MRYELSSGPRHHHLVCIRCKGVADVPASEDMNGEKKRIYRTHHFTVLRHSLEFFGFCERCHA
jgi:Fe2+ or Zn2+ uptake regulation protein